MKSRAFIQFSKKSKKQIQRLPQHIVDKVLMWVLDVEQRGIAEVKKRKGYHDELLLGDRWGQHSIRLSRSYRLIYRTSKANYDESITILEITKHDY